MINNYFTHYSTKEQKVVNDWLNGCTWLQPLVLSAEAANTGLHDFRVTLKDGTVFIVEVKIDEPYWYYKTGNVGIDYLSAFIFRSVEEEKMYKQELNFWVNPSKLTHFKNSIHIEKWGKLVTCDADVQLYYVENEFYIPYDNCLLQSKTVNFEQNYDLRINKKKDYGITDNWESATYLAKPRNFKSYVADPNLVSCEVANIGDLMNAVERAKMKFPNRSK